MEFKIELNSVKDMTYFRKGLYNQTCIHTNQIIKKHKVLFYRVSLTGSEHFVTKITIWLELLSEQGPKQTAKQLSL